MSDAGRAAFERTHGPLRELAPDGSLRPAAHRPRYFVVTRSAYVAGGEPLQDVDILTEPGRRPAIEQAESTGAVAATDLVKLARSQRGGLVVFAPVHSGPVRGVVAGSFAVPVLEHAIRRTLGEDARMRVEAANGLIAAAGPSPRRGAPRRSVTFGGRDYTVVAAAAPEDGLRIGLIAPLAGLAAHAARGPGAEQRRRSRRRVAIGEARFADAFEASPIGQALATPEGASRASTARCATITGHRADALRHKHGARPRPPVGPRARAGADGRGARRARRRRRRRGPAADGRGLDPLGAAALHPAARHRGRAPAARRR